MARNIEIKARIESVAVVVSKAALLADSGPSEIIQDDTFFNCAQGRLKLRAFSESTGELIFYRRADAQGPKVSFYVRTPTVDAQGPRAALTLAYGQCGRVQKTRMLYLVGRTRIHLDCVTGLGDFLELEVVLEEGEEIESGTREAHALMAQLGVTQAQLIEGAYVDLLARG